MECIWKRYAKHMGYSGGSARLKLMNDGVSILTKFTLIAATAIALIVAPAWATDECDVLCDPEFYATAAPKGVQELIDAGADVNARDADGKSPLHWVAKASPETIMTLLEAGGDVNARDYLDRTPLHFVSATSTPENVALLLGAGAEVNARTANDWTPLHGVAKFGIPENIMILLDAGADATARTEMGETPLEFAAINVKIKDSEAYVVLRAAKEQ